MIPFSQSEKKIRKDRKKIAIERRRKFIIKKIIWCFPEKKLIKLDKSDPEAKKRSLVRFFSV